MISDGVSLNVVHVLADKRSRFYNGTINNVPSLRRANKGGCVRDKLAVIKNAKIVCDADLCSDFIGEEEGFRQY